eukprot:3833719-Prorocentrum_lima.AAC.1
MLRGAKGAKLTKEYAAVPKAILPWIFCSSALPLPLDAADKSVTAPATALPARTIPCWTTEEEAHPE